MDLQIAGVFIRIFLYCSSAEVIISGMFLGSYMRFHSFFVLFLFLNVAILPNSFAKSLDEAVIQAWTVHPTLKAVEANEGRAFRERQEAFSSYLPTLSLTGMAGRQFGDNSTTRGLSVSRGQGYSYLWEVQSALRQSFYDGGGRAGRVASAEARQDALEPQKDFVRLGLAGSVIASYLEIVRGYHGLALIESHRSQLQDYLDRLDSARAEGAVDEAEYRQALDIVLSWDVVVPDYEAKLQNAQASYYELVGEPAEGSFETPSLDAKFYSLNLFDAIEEARYAHPLILEQKATLRSLQHDLEAGYSEFKPRLDGELSYLKSDKKDLLGGEIVDARATMRMSWDFETGGAAFHRIGQQKFLKLEGEERLKEIEQQVERDIRFAYNEYDASVSNLVALEKRREIAQDIFKTSLEQFEGARISLLQLMQAENAAFQQDLALVDAQGRVWAARYGVVLARGILDAFGFLPAEGLGMPMPPAVDQDMNVVSDINNDMLADESVFEE